MLKWAAVAASATAASFFSGRTSKAMDDCWLLTKEYNKFESNCFNSDEWIQLRNEARSTAQWNGICSILAGACSYGLYRYLKPSY